MANPTEFTQQGPAGGVTPYLTIRGGKAAEAAAFYARAFEAEEQMRMKGPDGERLIHCHLRINGASVLLADDFSTAGAPPAAGVTIHLQVDDPQGWWDRAVAAGVDVRQQMTKQFWGDLYGDLKDPYGHAWSIGGKPKE